MASYIGNFPVVQATRTVSEYLATAGQTTFTANGGYIVGYVDVFVNGIQLQNVDFTATNGTTITLAIAAAAGDDVRIVAYGTFSSANHYLKTESDTRFIRNDVSAGIVYNAGNIGIGITPSAWASGNFNAFQIGAGGSLVGRATGQASPLDEVYLSANAFNDGTGSWKYIGAAASTQYFQDAGQHVWRIAPSGTAGTAITWTQAMTLDTSGNLAMTGGGQIRGNAANVPPILADSNGNTASCRAWVKFNGSNGGLFGSFNVSSVTRNAAGDYTVNFAVAMPDTNYAFATSGMYGNGTDAASGHQGLNALQNSPPTASSIRFFWKQGNNSTAWDSGQVCVSIFR